MIASDLIWRTYQKLPHAHAIHTRTHTRNAAHSLSLAKPLWTPSNWVWIVFLNWDSTVPWVEQEKIIIKKRDA